MGLKRAFVKAIPLILALAVLLVASLYAQDKPEAPKLDKETQAEVDYCLGCHSAEAETGPVVDFAKLSKSPHREMGCKSCHSSITGDPHTPEMTSVKAACADCHPDQAEQYSKSAHARKDKEKGDHPTCVSCHSNDGSPHSILHPVNNRTRDEQVRLCSNCHADQRRMDRYGVQADAVESYDHSFHGKALLAFGNQKTAVCTDCHGSHTVLDPNDDRAPTNRANADKLCSKPDCHPGAKTNFAMSGANHLRLKIKEDVVLRTIDLFFRSLTICVIGFMLGGIGLDLRRKVFGPHPPKCGRPVGLLIVASFASLLTAIGCAAFSIATVATRALLAAVVLLGVAYVLYFATRKKGVASAPVKKHRRFSKTQRIQHIALMICFTTLIMTGLPQRFSDVLWLRSVYQFIGGLSGAREIHRVAAIGLISVFVWHTTDLFIRWAKLGFKLNALTMLPTKKDALDFLHMSECYLGLRKEEPRFDRFQFKQKMDYLAEYWGVPLMVVTGFIMWFPIYWANRLPEIALSAALVAHGWEATLAFLAIIAWHIYNEHFNPDAFPMSKVWLTGELTEEEMLREHPLELERIQKNDGGAAAE